VAGDALDLVLLPGLSFEKEKLKPLLLLDDPGRDEEPLTERPPELPGRASLPIQLFLFSLPASSWLIVVAMMEGCGRKRMGLT
jgi:hypothetical protein